MIPIYLMKTSESAIYITYLHQYIWMVENEVFDENVKKVNWKT